MDPKSTVVKSKSSNSGISKSKDDRKPQSNKKTRSNADFPYCPKKRGVYVEKRLAKLNLVNNVKDLDAVIQKPPTRSRPGQKKFLASVLTILSKSTTGTQYPEIDDDTKAILKKKPTLKVPKDEEMSNNVIRKKEYKSRVLGKKFVKEDRKKMVVLQSKKEIAQTPSNSEWSYKEASLNSNTSNNLIYDDSKNNNIGAGLNIADELKNALLEGRNMKMKKFRYQEDEPKTLVSDEPKVQKNLYNFFVDLLETTISVYNVKAEYDNAPSETSKTNLQINEAVANKLNIDKSKPNDEVVVNPHFVDIQDESDYEDYDYNKSITIKPSEQRLKTSKNKKLKSDSFIHANKKSLLPKSKSLETKKTMFKNKNDLINVLKQQLVETRVLEEPKSIFQALRVMARNKKRITFDPSIEYKTITDECILKRRKVISSRRTKNKNNDTINYNNIYRPKTSYINADKNENRKKVKHVTDNRKMYSGIDKDSYHSLEVYGYDYESKQPQYPQMYFNKPKDVTFTYHSSPTTSELDFDINDAILNPTSEFSIKKLSAVI